MPWPTPTASPSPQPNPGLWQLAQDCADVTERRVSKYSFLPSAAFSGVYGFSFGNGIVEGLRYRALRASSPPGAFCVISTLRLSPTMAAPKLIVANPIAPTPAAAMAAAKMSKGEEPSLGMQCPPKGCHLRHRKTFEAMHALLA